MSQVLRAMGEALRRSHPDKTVFVRQEYWFYISRSIERVYRVSMLPGLDDTECSIHNFPSLKELNDWVYENTNPRCRADSLSAATDTPTS